MRSNNCVQQTQSVRRSVSRYRSLPRRSSASMNELTFVKPFDEASLLQETRQLLPTTKGAARSALLAIEVGLTSVRMLPPVVTPESLAWTALWTRAISLAMAVPQLLSGPSSLPLWVLSRSTLELLIHAVLVVGDETPAFQVPLPPHDAPGTLNHQRDRLRGYLAWSLMHDLKVARSQEMAANSSERPESATRPRSSYPDQVRAALDRLLGDEEIVSDPEYELDRRRAADAAARSVARIQQIQGDPRLAEWTRKIISLSAKRKSYFVPELAALLYDMKLSDALQQLRVAYPSLRWTEGSKVIHGSTLESSVLVNGSEAMLRVVDVPEALEERGREVAENCLYTLLALSTLGPAIGIGA